MVIRTYGGKLVINDSTESEINVYGVQDTLAIEKCAMNSTHIYGISSFISIKNGHIEFKDGSKASGLHFVSTTANNKVAFDNIKVTMPSNFERPTFSRDGEIDIDENGTLVANIVQSGKDEYVWLTRNGIYEQIMISSSKTGDKTFASDGTASEQSIALEICNNFEGRTGSDPLAEGILDENRNIIELHLESVKDSGVTASDAEKNTPAVLEGSGTINDPFVIRDARTYCAWRDTCNSSNYGSTHGDYKFVGVEGKTLYVKCVGTVDLDGVLITEFSIRNYVIDGNNATFINVKCDKSISNFSNGLFGHKGKGTVVIKNLTIQDSTLIRGLVADKIDDLDLTFENIMLKNVKTDHGFFTCQPQYNGNRVTFRNCDTDSDCLMNTTDGWYAGGYVSCLDNTTAIFENCDARGTVISASTSHLGGFVGQCLNANITFTNCTNALNIISTANKQTGPYHSESNNSGKNVTMANSTFTGTISTSGGVFNNGFTGITASAWSNNFNASNYSITNVGGKFNISYTGSNIPAKVEIATCLWGLDYYNNGTLTFGCNWCKYVGYATKWLTANGATVNTGWDYFDSYSNIIKIGQNLYGKTIKGATTDLSVLDGKVCKTVNGILYYDATQDSYGNWSMLTYDNIEFAFTEYDAEGHVIGMGKINLSLTPYVSE